MELGAREKLGWLMFRMDGFMSPADCRERAKLCRLRASASPSNAHFYREAAGAWDQLATQYEDLEGLRSWFLLGCIDFGSRPN
jgi:hypothetical protein